MTNHPQLAGSCFTNLSGRRVFIHIQTNETLQEYPTVIKRSNGKSPQLEGFYWENHGKTWKNMEKSWKVMDESMIVHSHVWRLEPLITIAIAFWSTLTNVLALWFGNPKLGWLIVINPNNPMIIPYLCLLQPLKLSKAYYEQLNRAQTSWSFLAYESQKWLLLLMWSMTPEGHKHLPEKSENIWKKW